MSLLVAYNLNEYSSEKQKNEEKMFIFHILCPVQFKQHLLQVTEWIKSLEMSNSSYTC